MEDFVHIDEYGLLGKNFYWRSRERLGLAEADLQACGVMDERVQVARRIIEPLQKTDAKFQERGMRIFVQEGLRPKAMYEFVYKKRVAEEGQKEADRLFNMADMFHASGNTVDICPWDPVADKQIYTRKGEDGNDAFFINFYRDKTDELSKQYQELQDFMISTMLDQGFRIGSKKEYFHFDYRPEILANYEQS